MDSYIALVVICIVALFTRAWIEIPALKWENIYPPVALFTRAWIEISGT